MNIVIVINVISCIDNITIIVDTSIITIINTIMNITSCYCYHYCHWY